MDIWLTISEQWQQQSVLEIFAVIAATAYVWLASEESSWCWPCGFIATIIYVYLYWDVTLIFQMLLNIYYVGMAVWGFLSWQKQGVNKVAISSMSLRLHSLVISGGMFGSLLVYMIASIWLHYELIVLDIMVTIFSLLATYLTVMKKLENWVYWTIVNIASIYLLMESGLYLSILLMLIYIVIAIRGLSQWSKTYQKLNNSGVEQIIT